MRYVLRADASQSIGSGHVMRSSAIAEELIARGEDVIFVGQISDVQWLAVRINGLGFSQIISRPDDFVSNPNTDVLILDSYLMAVNDRFIQPGIWRGIVAVADDLTPAYKADLIIRPGLPTDWVNAAGIKTLTGPKYIPFRKSLEKVQRKAKNHTGLEILVVGGGTDSFGFVEALSRAIKDIAGNFHASVFTNDSSGYVLDSRFTVIPIGPELDEKAMDADLVFTTASTASLEFIAREVAVGIGCAVDNQEGYYASLSALEVAVPIGRFIQGNWEINHAKIAELITSVDLRNAYKSKCANLIDLKGAGRIVDEIIKL